MSELRVGFPASGKKALAESVYNELRKDKLKVERLDSLDVRPLFPETGFTPDEVNGHVKRAGHLCAMLEKNGVIVVASFVSPYLSSREFARNVATNFIEVYMDTRVEACENRDEKGHYLRARKGEYCYFPGVDITYEEPLNTQIVIDVDHLSLEESTQQIIKFLKKHVIKNQL